MQCVIEEHLLKSEIEEHLRSDSRNEKNQFCKVLQFSFTFIRYMKKTTQFRFVKINAVFR